MKKALSVILAVIMIFSVCSGFSVLAVSPEEKNPIVFIAGDGPSIYDKDGNQVYKINYDVKNEMPKAVARVLFPYFTNAIFFGRYEEYYDAFAKEVNDIFAPSHLDENGEATNGTDIIKSKYEENEVNCHTDKCNANGDPVFCPIYFGMTGEEILLKLLIPWIIILTRF